MRREYSRTAEIPPPPPSRVALRRVQLRTLPAIDLPPARITLPTPPVKAVEPGRPRKMLSPLGVAPAPREGLGPEEESDGWLLSGGLGILLWLAVELHRWL